MPRKAVPASGQRAAIYARVATQAQDNPDAALSSQIAACEAYATAHGYANVDRYIDAGWSGEDDQRPALVRLLQDAKAGRLDVVVVATLNRIARSTRLLAMTVRQLEANGSGLVSVTEHIDSKMPAGRARRAIVL